jgi:outer membrane protein assembly factor BamB
MKSVYIILSIAVVLSFSQAFALSEMTFEWAMNTSNVFEGKTFGGGLQNFATFYDIDSDGVNEILFGTRRGDSKRIWCWNQNGEVEWTYPPMEEEGLPGDPGSKVSLVDVDNDGVYELAFGLMSRPGGFYVLNPDGSLVWVLRGPDFLSAEPGDEVGDSRMLGAAQALDVDGDGFVEFFQTDNNGFAHRFSHDGKHVWTSAQGGSAIQGQTTIADIDQDGEYEVLYGANDHFLYCLKAETGAEKWRYDTGANMQTNQVIVIDIDEDGEYEALVWNDLGVVFSISFYGTEEWRWTIPTGENIRLCQALGDVDADGQLEMVINTGAGVYCLEVSSGPATTKWYINRTELGVQGIIPEGFAGNNEWRSYNIIVDIDGDDKQEAVIVTRSSGGAAPLVVDAATGELEAWYYNEDINSINGHTWGDVDQDGESELMFEGDGFGHPMTQNYVITMNGKFPADAWWPEYYHTALPADDQQDADWLKLKAAASNSLWFPMPEGSLISIAALLCIGLLKRRL